MTFRPWAGFCAALMILTGCSTVTVMEPIGEEPIKIVPADWDGFWSLKTTDGDATVCAVKVTDAARGTMHLAAINEREGRFVLEQVSIHVRRHGDATLASIMGEPPEPGEGYLWGRLEKAADGTVVCWMPVAERFAEAVKAGELPGSMRETSSVLGQLSGKQLDRVLADESPFLEWRRPLIFTRVIRAPSPAED